MKGKRILRREREVGREGRGEERRRSGEEEF
jgi:hypothetical protein